MKKAGAITSRRLFYSSWSKASAYFFFVARGFGAELRACGSKPI
jgi:hypothetical protein